MTPDIIEESLAEHKGWLEEQRAHQREQLAQTRELPRTSHPQRRLFTDDQFRAAHADEQVANLLAKKLGCCDMTVRTYARRLGLQLENPNDASWTREHDALLLRHAEGYVSMYYVTQHTGHSSEAIRRRAEVLGLMIRVRRQGDASGLKKVIPVKHELDCEPISVGDDKLLLKLYQVHRAPRDEVYPGSVRAA